MCPPWHHGKFSCHSTRDRTTLTRFVPQENVCRKFTSSNIPGLRVKGGKAPGPKPIRADYDTDDGRIVELKQMGHTDEQVAARLIKEGRVRYNARTITHRYMRLRKALVEKEGEMLNDELTDWHVGEVSLIVDSCPFAALTSE